MASAAHHLVFITVTQGFAVTEVVMTKKERNFASSVDNAIKLPVFVSEWATSV